MQSSVNRLQTMNVSVIFMKSIIYLSFPAASAYWALFLSFPFQTTNFFAVSMGRRDKREFANRAKKVGINNLFFLRCLFLGAAFA